MQIQTLKIRCMRIEAFILSVGMVRSIKLLEQYVIS